MKFKDLFCLKEADTTTEDINLGLYADMLGIKENFDFILNKDKVANQTEFDALCSEAEYLLTTNLKQRGMLNGNKIYKIPVELVNLGISTTGAIGSMTVVGDDEGKIETRFHRLQSGYWDEYSKSYPEAKTKGKYKYEIFFPLLVD